ncbi:UDPGT domain-containing protein [Cephalotus follicularis]|uniref:UDPGT domain-containing protein n=1 Tax=Cephalotus follicularis TaxID=3775 RepID=A0A1Q3BVQ3_CEPFO|nr:UDPGT domain-containing protein [Cephalotus follicularis]
MAQRKENIVMFPFMAQGHIIPFLALALHIEKTKGYTITFVNTPLNIEKLRSSLPLNSSINLLKIPFNGLDHGLPPNTENTDVVPYPLIIKLLEASTSLKPVFKKILIDIIQAQNGHPPLCVIADIFFGWTASVAQELGLFHAIFSGAGGYGLACYYSMWTNLPHKKVNSDEFLLPDFQQATKIHTTQLPLSMLEANGRDAWSVFQEKNLPEWVKSNGILFNTVEQFDQLGLMYFKRKLGVPVWAIGPVLLSMDNRARINIENGITVEFCKEWLDTKPKKSVLYVSFGSNNTISLSHMMELAMALEASGKNFIWVVRPPIGFDINSDFKAKEWLPEGFEERIRESKKGLLVPKWAPQVEVLSHTSLSAFLSHCGWNSALEALSRGVLLLGWGMAGEQFFNVKFLEEEVGVCVEVARGKSCEVKHEDIVEKIELVMGDTEKGKEMRRKACKIREMIKNAMKDESGLKGSSVKSLDDFLSSAMLSMRKTKTA